MSGRPINRTLRDRESELRENFPRNFFHVARKMCLYERVNAHPPEGRCRAPSSPRAPF